MRYGKDQKQATRQRILEAAGRRFKQDGIDAAGVAAVMSDAGLTNGGSHARPLQVQGGSRSPTSQRAATSSTRELPRRALRSRRARIADPRLPLPRAPRRERRAATPSAALLDETSARPPAPSTSSPTNSSPPPTRSRPAWSRRNPDAARTHALTLFGLMVGTLQLSRALTDRDLSDQLLAQGAETALQLLDDRACTRA